VGAALRVSSILARGHDDSRAATVLLESVSEHNGRVELRRVLAEFYVDVGNCASARSVLEGLIQEAEDPADIAMLGVCELMEGRFDEARRLATRSLTLKPTADGHFLIGNVEFESGNVGPAMKAWDVTLALDPDHVDALRVSARVLCAVNPAEARRRLARAAALVPADSDALLAVCPPREKPD
jgi:tetratricopeptide (TPR) repeat protein